MRIRKTQAARKHRVGTQRIVHTMLNATSIRTFGTSKGEAVEWVGPDDRGREPRIIAVFDHDDQDTPWIIHAQPTTRTKGVQR